MIPRTLVPLKLSPVGPSGSSQNGHRHTSALDERIVVPSGPPPETPLDPRSSIPAYLPLDVLTGRQLIPRDMPAKKLESTTAIPSHVPLAVLDTRTVVPPGARLTAAEARAHTTPLPAIIFEEMLEPDLFTTGEVHLLSNLEKPKDKDWQWLSRSFSLVVHVGVILLILFAPQLFTESAQRQQQTELAQEQLSKVFLPPEVRDVPKIKPRAEPPSPRIRLDPRILKSLAPPEPAPLAGPKNPAPPQPEETQPAAPPPKPASPPSSQSAPAFKSLSQMDNPPRPKHPLNLQLPRLPPGMALRQSAENALKDNNASNSTEFAAPMPQAPGGPLPSGQQGQGMLGAGVQILSPTEGVDFSNYLARMLARIKENWLAVMPISARMGDKGVVIMQFRIMHDGSLPNSDPVLVRTSGKDPLDRAAGGAITASNPFEPLPSAFTGPDLELRIIFLYNLPIDYNYNQ